MPSLMKGSHFIENINNIIVVYFFGRAASTTKTFSFRGSPFNFFMIKRASSLDPISTNAHPLDSPLSASVSIFTETTVP